MLVVSKRGETTRAETNSPVGLLHRKVALTLFVDAQFGYNMASQI
jgi:hypothetical protein